MGLRDTLRKAASLLVEMPAEETPVHIETSAGELDQLLAELDKGPSPPSVRTVEEVVRAAEGPNLDEIRAPASAPPVSADGKIDFPALYGQAGLPASPF